MIRTQIYLTPKEHEGIKALAQETNKRQSELIRLAIDEFLVRKKPEDRLSKIRQAKGMWKDHQELDLADLRTEFDRF